MYRSSTKSIIPETAIFAAKMTHHKERDNYSPENLTNFTNPLASNIESGNDTFIFKEARSKYDRLEFVEDIRKKIFTHKYEKHWALVRRRELN